MFVLSYLYFTLLLSFRNLFFNRTQKGIGWKERRGESGRSIGRRNDNLDVLYEKISIFNKSENKLKTSTLVTQVKKK